MIFWKKIVLLTFLIVLSFLLMGCSALKNLTPSFEKVGNVSPMNVGEKRLYVPVKLEGNEYAFMLDTGASAAIIKDPTIIKDKKAFNVKKSNSFGHIRNTHQFLLNGENAFFSSETFVYNYIDKQTICPPEYAGLVGNDFINYDDFYVVDLNLSNSEIGLYKNLDELDLNDYREVPSKFFRFGFHFQIALEINNSLEYFHFDTGNTTPYSILLLDKKSKVQLKELNQNRIYSNGNLKNRFLAVYEDLVKMSGFPVEGVYITSPDWLKDGRNNVGYQFIKRFDWIIDYRNKKVYFKPRNSSLKSMKAAPFEFSIVNNNLVVAVKEAQAKRFSLNDVIYSVNNEVITEDNICQMLSRLNNSIDLNELNIGLKEEE